MGLLEKVHWRCNCFMSKNFNVYTNFMKQNWYAFFVYSIVHVY